MIHSPIASAVHLQKYHTRHHQAILPAFKVIRALATDNYQEIKTKTKTKKIS